MRAPAESWRSKLGGIIPFVARYLMNHCRCDVRLDDDHLHGDVGAAFWPDTQIRPSSTSNGNSPSLSMMIL